MGTVNAYNGRRAGPAGVGGLLAKRVDSQKEADLNRRSHAPPDRVGGGLVIVALLIARTSFLGFEDIRHADDCLRNFEYPLVLAHGRLPQQRVSIGLR